MGVKYTKDEIENQIEQALLNQIDSEPILVSVSLLFTSNHKNQEKKTRTLKQKSEKSEKQKNQKNQKNLKNQKNHKKRH